MKNDVNTFKEILDSACQYIELKLEKQINQEKVEKAIKHYEATGSKHEEFLKKFFIGAGFNADSPEETIKVIIFNEVKHSKTFKGIKVKFINLFKIVKIYSTSKYTAQRMAVLNYTSNAYQPINEAAALANGLFKRLYLSSLKNHFLDSKFGTTKEMRKEWKRLSKDERKKQGKDYKDLLKKRTMAKALDKEYQQYLCDLYTEINMTADALSSVVKKSNVHVYSGTWMTKSKLFASYKKNKTIKWDMFTSTSKNLAIAKRFIGGISGPSGIRECVGKNALLDIKLTGRGAVDITQYKGNDCSKVMSVFSIDEEEVLCPPGTKIKIKEVIDNVDLLAYDGSKNTIKIANKKEIKDGTQNDMEFW